MNYLLLHDLACAIERDADDAPSDRSDRNGRGRAAWIAEWQYRFEEHSVEPRREHFLRS